MTNELRESFSSSYVLSLARGTMNLLWGKRLNSRFPVSDLGAAHPPPRHIAVNVSLLCVGNSGGRTDRQTDGQTDRPTDRPHSAPRLTSSWCDARDSRRYTDCYVDRRHWPGTVICSHVYQTRNSKPEMALWNSFNIKVFAANDV